MSDTLKPCPFCGIEIELEDMGKGQPVIAECDNMRCAVHVNTNSRNKEATIAAWNTRALDEASYRAGIEAAAKLFEKQAALSNDAEWCERLYDMAEEIRCLPTPSTLPQEGGEQC